MKKFYHKYGKWIRLAGFLCVFFGINWFLNTNLIQSALSRIIIHEMRDTGSGNYDCVVFGESHSSYAIDPEVLREETGMNTMNASIGGEYMRDMYYMALEMYAHHTPKMVVIDVDYQYFIHVPDTRNTVMSTLVYNNYPCSFRKLQYAAEVLPQKEYRAALFPWMNSRNNVRGMMGIFWNKRTEAYKKYRPSAVTEIDPNDTYQGKGFIFRARTYQRDETQRVGIWWNEKKVDYDKSVRYFKKLVELCRSKGSNVVMITSPINAETLLLNETTVKEYHEIENYFAQLAKDNDLTYYNFNLVRPEQYRRSTEDYWDYDGHMYGDAARRYSRFLGRFLKRVADGEDVKPGDYLYRSIHEMQSVNPEST